MPSKIIPCIDCQKETEKLEKAGGITVISCEPIPEDRNKESSKQRCEIVWKIDEL
jgi:hypothetical protein